MKALAEELNIFGRETKTSQKNKRKII